ncbi:hypothetical protein AAZX31_16G079400 [Glycine max]
MVTKFEKNDSENVFGVSTKSMQLSFDARGNSVPTILLLMQRHLYAQGGLQGLCLYLFFFFTHSFLSGCFSSLAKLELGIQIASKRETWISVI